MTNHGDQAAGLRKAAGGTPSIQSKKAICCIAVASGKGGVGKTFISVNLALALAGMRKKVLLVDADLGLANADIVLGIYPELSMQDAIFRGKTLAEVVAHTEYGVDLLAASSGAKEMVSLGAARMKLFIEELLAFASDYDVLLFDCAAGIDSSVTSFIAATPQTTIVATPDPTSIMDVYALVKLAYQDDLTQNISLIVNMAESDEAGTKVAETLNQVSQRYLSRQLEVLGIVPRSREIAKAVLRRRPFISEYADHDVAKRLRQIAKSILQRQTAVTKLEDLSAERLVKGLMQV